MRKTYLDELPDCSRRKRQWHLNFHLLRRHIRRISNLPPAYVIQVEVFALSVIHHQYTPDHSQIIIACGKLEFEEGGLRDVPAQTILSPICP